jgi:glycosyltransferase involved in cell wall biosynthesis
MEVPVPPRTIHVIEPTLTGEQGHCLGLVRTLCEQAPELRMELWIGRGARVPALDRLGVQVHLHFFRRLRKLQLLPLYRRLLRSDGRILVSTAGRTHLVVLGWAARGLIPPNKAYLYFHWLRLDPRKTALMRRFARRQPNVVVLGTTRLVEQELRGLGFRNVSFAPYPATMSPRETDLPLIPFRHVLFAGAARMDKGFRHIVELVAKLEEWQETLPVSVQVSGDYFDKLDAVARAEIHRLTGLRYPHLTVHPDTMSATDYAERFAGGICIQPYDRSEYADRASGVTLDALVAGCPVVTVSGTWMARLVNRFDAGIAVEEPTPSALREAIRRIIAEYPHYQRNARIGGETLRQEVSATALIDLLSRAE